MISKRTNALNARSGMNCTKTFENSKWILMKSGLWIAQKTTKREIVKIMFNFGFNVVVNIIICHNIVNAIERNNTKLLNRMTCILISMVNYSAKSFTLMVNKGCFQSILLDLGSNTFNAHSDVLNKHIQFIYRISKLFFRYFIVSLTAYILIGSFLPLLVDISLSIPAPFDTGKYDIIYKVAHFFATGYLAFNTLGLDMLFLTLLSICVAQLNILQERLSKVLEDARKECKSNTKLTLEVHSILRDIVILHETINRFALKISVLLSFPLFIQYTCGCFILCNTVLQLTVLREPGSMTSLSMCVHAGVTFAQMAGYHWIGNEVIFKSEKIIESSYISKWYQLDLKEQKILLLLMERAKRPLIVKVYKFIFISLDSLGVIVRWAYSVFALIKVRYG